jgi:hypothetical protein
MPCLSLMSVDGERTCGEARIGARLCGGWSSVDACFSYMGSTQTGLLIGLNDRAG